MGEIIHDAFLLYNFPLTFLVGLCVLYWLSVCLGLLDIGSLDADVDIDAGVDLSADLEAEVDVDAQHESHLPAGGGGLMAMLRFMNVHEVPLMVVLSFQFLFMWMFAMISNHYFNIGESFGIAALLMVGNLLVSAILTRIVTSPLRPLMRALKKDWDDVGSIIGCTGMVTTSEVTEKFGQVEIQRRGASTICTARIPEGGQALSKGDSALVIDFLADSQTCIVKRLEGDPIDI